METEANAVSRTDQELPTTSANDAVAAPVVEENRDTKENKWELNPTELRRLVEESRTKADTSWNDLLRVRADADNVRRRAERDVENAHKFALERFATELLPVKDSLELGLAAVTDNIATDVAKLREGMNLTLKILASTMEKFGIREINPINERFNPDLHQAMTVQPSVTVAPNTVLVVYQKGYTLNERLIRPALVIVSQSLPTSAVPKNDQT